VTWGKKVLPLSSRMSPSLCLSTSSWSLTQQQQQQHSSSFFVVVDLIVNFVVGDLDCGIQEQVLCRFAQTRRSLQMVWPTWLQCANPFSVWSASLVGTNGSSSRICAEAASFRIHSWITAPTSYTK
jgi:hypothetical protein